MQMASSLPLTPAFKSPLALHFLKELISVLVSLQFNSWVRKIRWRRDGLPTPVFMGFPGGSAGKESACNVGDLGLMPGLGRSPGEGKGYPLQYCGLENSMGCIVQGIAKSQAQLSDYHFHFYSILHLVVKYSFSQQFLNSVQTSFT